MRAVRTIDGAPTVLDVEEPPAGQWPVLTVAAAGICGSDLGLLGFGLPITLGHEIAGTIDGDPSGTAYCVEPTVFCGICDQCRSGATARCDGAGRHGLLGVAFDGGDADKVAVPPSGLVPLPAGLAISDASLVEPLAVCWHALKRVAAAPGERALVVGGGSVGLLAVAAACAMGLEVDLDARHRHQLVAGERLGARTEKLRRDYDVVVEAAGTDSSLASCVQRAAPGGRIAVVGVNHGDLTVAGLPFLMKELSIVASYCYGSGAGGREFTAAAAALAADPEIAATVVTHRFPLADAAEAFRVAADRASAAIKVVLHP